MLISCSNFLRRCEVTNMGLEGKVRHRTEKPHSAFDSTQQLKVIFHVLKNFGHHNSLIIKSTKFVGNKGVFAKKLELRTDNFGLSDLLFTEVQPPILLQPSVACDAGKLSWAATDIKH